MISKDPQNGLTFPILNIKTELISKMSLLLATQHEILRVKSIKDLLRVFYLNQQKVELYQT